MVDFRYMNGAEIYSYLLKFGSDEQRLLAEKLFIDESNLDWDQCPNCFDRSDAIEGLEASKITLEDVVQKQKDKLSKIWSIVDD